MGQACILETWMNSNISYDTVRLALTGLITSLGVVTVATDAQWPDPFLRAQRMVIPFYIAVDTVCNDMSVDRVIHHVLVAGSVLCCIEPISGEDCGRLVRMMSDVSVNEGMAVLTCLDKLTQRRFKTTFIILHLLNIALVRRRVWLTCRDESSKNVKSKRVRSFVKAMCNAMLMLDVYWTGLLLKQLALPLRYPAGRP